MGFEFRITASLTQEQRRHLAQLLEAGTPQAPGAAMPENDIRLTDTGLYVCQYLRPNPWHGLEGLRAWLDAQGVDYAVAEIDD
ncbi:MULTISPECIES: hypothetical protein [unclassified Janthinobacterium]|uniref:hypothetical protein n=1 Tax=unclassified Janthinobacterium TaxID=2610881 RepID=UPI0008878079|nr:MULTISPECIES: hypothetical protein [unclassified Janthinobacterium]SDA76862.1 hypothetical protein SAMN03159349_04269 [Janthinobacterium sp. 551a]SFB60589.1 hypothetical protein SAMN03159300_10991 [Janthinobacterium sp. 344]